jgi:hypothetical protein
MPCRDFYDDNPSAYYADTVKGLQKQVSFSESALCQTLAAFQKLINTNVFEILKDTTPLDYIDYKEAGITRDELDKWWSEHKRKDEESRKKEAEEKDRKRLRRHALAKLSQEERKVLGIK